MLAPFPLLLALLVSPTPARPAAAEVAHKAGQAAMDRDRFEEAVGQFQLSLRLDPKLSDAHLSLAAAYLALGQDSQAAPHLGAYLDARPNHFIARLPYAELLAKLERFAEARGQLDRFIADVQGYPLIADQHLLASHTRLMELALQVGDEYTERLHRGIGLYLLALKRRDLGGADASRLVEELLCKSAGELTLARLRRPAEARPSLYLHDVWRELGQRQPAERCLRHAESHAGLSYLTPAELRSLHLARCLRELELGRR